jgi:hypothetical protein
VTPRVGHSVKPLVVGLLVLGVVLSVSVVPSVFTVDDNNYLVNVLALRQGRVTIANTEGLTPSRELLFFDPTFRSRAVTSTPVASTAPPLYAILALPFSIFGWRGLVALNTLAYLATILLVFVYVRRYAAQASTPWFAAAAFAFGGYTIEYALGLWPQALSFALCTAGIVAAGRAIDPNVRGRAVFVSAAGAGFLLALAAGVRYQNAVVLAAAGGALVVLASSRRLVACLAYAGAAAVPLSVSAAINHARFASWNPISKGPGYLNVPVSDAKSAFLDPIVMFWAQVVDYSWRPELADVNTKAWLRYDPTTGAHLIFGAIAKKAVLQSAPWVILAFLIFAAAWLPASRLPRERRRQLRLLSLVAAAIVGTFAVSGVDRHDGLSFNARYFLELLPISAVGFAWALDQRVSARIGPLAAGAALGVVLVGVILFGTPMLGGPETPLWTARQIATLKTPLALAALAGALWLMDVLGRGRPALLLGTLGACLGWGLMLHLSTDVGMSQFMRANNLARTRALAEVLPNKAAIVAHWGNADAVGPLLLTRDIVVLDVAADEGRDSRLLIRDLFGRNRRVFLLEDGVSSEIMDRIRTDLPAIPAPTSVLRLVELRHSSE